MFDNVGEKIKALAKTKFWISNIVWILIGILAFVLVYTLADRDAITIFLGLCLAAIIIGVGIFLSYISVVKFYAFGDLVENTYIIANNSAISASNSEKAKFALEQNSLQQKCRPTCRVCYHVNPEEAEICQKCGEKL